MMPPMSTS